MVGVGNRTVEDVVAKTYDFVIVGGGTAGLVLARRLTEDATVTVLVLEAGQNRLGVGLKFTPEKGIVINNLQDPKIDIPALMIQLYEDPNYDWGFKSVPQTHMHDRVIAQPRGKVLGGSSAINFMMLAHPSKVDIDSWEKLGNQGWNFEQLNPYYQKFETYNPPDDQLGRSLGSKIIEKALHGSSGPIQTTFPHGTSEVDAAWRPTFQTLGLGAEQDPTKGSTLGGYPVLKLIDKQGRRSYAASAYYAPIAARPNLTLITSAHARKIIVENATGELTIAGVAFTVCSQSFVALASKEIILSAGALQTPQILELSGIGSRSILEKYNIDVLVENQNVGENLQDHVLLPLGFEALDGTATAETMKIPGVLDWALEEWLEGRGGPLASGVSGTSFLSYSSILPRESRPVLLQRAEAELLATEDFSAIQNMQFNVQKQVFLDDKEADIQVNFARTGFSPYTSDSLASLFQHSDPGNYVSAGVALTHPFSRGSIHVTSSDPTAPPRIDPRYLSNALDLAMLADGILFVQKIFETKPMADYIKDNPDGKGKKTQPSFQYPAKLDRNGAIEHVKKATISSWHPIGTCAMLPRDDGGVVDERLRVYGVKNLRVVDASIMPLHVRGNIISSVYAIAERAADLIKEDLRREV